jgi:hypothetical protein
MHMIGHETVGNYCKLFLLRSAQNLPPHHVHGASIDEERVTLIGAECQEISVEAGVVERLEAARIACERTEEQASGVPGTVRPKADTTTATVRLKADTTVVSVVSGFSRT